MNKTLCITFLLLLSLCGKAQDTAYSALGNTVNALYSSLSDSNATNRSRVFEQLFTREGQVNAVIQKNASTSSHALGSWRQFLDNSTPFYAAYKVDYDETEREIDYYVDLASVHSLVYQTATDRKTGSVYRQMLWIQIDLVYAGHRWYIDHVTWINEVPGIPVRDALLQDTLWHKPSR